MKIRVFLSIITLILLVFNSFAVEIWFEDTNGGKSGNIPKDYVAKFIKTEDWDHTLSCVNTIMIRTGALILLGEKFIENVLKPFLYKTKKNLALDVVGATWTYASIRRIEFRQKELELLEKLKFLGIKPCCIIFQSALSKPLRKGKTGEVIHYPLERRIEDVIEYMKLTKAIFPNIKFGLIDALPTKGEDYKTVYNKLFQRLKEENLKMDYIILDAPFSTILKIHGNRVYNLLKDVQEYVKSNLKIKYGVILTSIRGGMTAGNMFYNEVISYLNCYKNFVGEPDIYLVTSWFKYPFRTIPEECNYDFISLTCVTDEVCNIIRENAFIKDYSILKNICFIGLGNSK